MPNELGTAKRLWVLDAPTITFDQSLLNVGWSGPISMPLPAYLIEHPRGLVLFDTGLNPLAADDPEKVYGPLADQLGLHFPAELRIDRQLKNLGYSPSDVKYVVASHAHFDHIGGLGMFPDAEIFIGHGDLQYAAYPDPLPSTFFLPEDIARVNPAQWREVHGDFDVFGDGSLVILATPGHSPGETSMLVRLDGRNIILAGDTVHLRHNLENLLPMPFDANNQQAVQSLRRLKMLMAANDATVWISHDPEDWAELGPGPRCHE
jgi:glyoxylase-like metal-dependent hydrolase (beta-lactamase superfamily II)